MHLSPPGNQALKLTAARVIESTSISEESPWSRQNWDTLRWSRSTSEISLATRTFIRGSEQS